MIKHERFQWIQDILCWVLWVYIIHTYTPLEPLTSLSYIFAKSDNSLKNEYVQTLLALMSLQSHELHFLFIIKLMRDLSMFSNFRETSPWFPPICLFYLQFQTNEIYLSTFLSPWVTVSIVCELINRVQREEEKRTDEKSREMKGKQIVIIRDKKEKRKTKETRKRNCV